jgi:hypothetical protein
MEAFERGQSITMGDKQIFYAAQEHVLDMTCILILGRLPLPSLLSSTKYFLCHSHGCLIPISAFKRSDRVHNNTLSAYFQRSNAGMKLKSWIKRGLQLVARIDDIMEIFNKTGFPLSVTTREYCTSPEFRSMYSTHGTTFRRWLCRGIMNTGA